MYYHGQIVHHVYTLYIILVYSSWITSSANLGAMAPELNILVGNPLSIECTLFNTTIEYKKNIYKVNSSLIEFKFKNNYYSEEKTHIKNERKAEISINEASVEDTGIYTCLLKIPGLVHKPLVNVSHVIVGYKPQNVKDFRCISFSSFRKLSCSWLPKYNPIKTSYNLVLSMKSTLHECDYSPTDNSCDFDIVENTARNLTLRLMGENMFGKNEQYFHINQYSIIKPNAPKNLRHTEVTTNTITLSWEPLEYTQEDKDLFKSIVYVMNCIRLDFYKSEADNHPIIIDGIRETSITLTNLIPFNTYEVSLRCRTIQSQSDEYWSEFSTIYVKTKPDIPYLAPVLIPESFQTEKYNEENRSITIFWRPIPNENCNSNHFHYTIEYIQLFNHISRENNSVKHNSININAENTNYTFNNMDSNCAYNFKIYGTNSIAKSNNYSQIFVDKNENMPYKPTNIYVFSCGGGKYYIKWKQPPKNNISGAILNYTVFWCQSQISRQLPCKGPIDWIYTTNTSFTTLEFKDMETNYQFAVSANALKSSSGMSWAEYIVPCDERQKMDPPLTERINATTVRIYWSTPILLIDYYLLKLIWMYNKTVSYVYNVSGVQNQYYLTLDCNSYNADYEQQYTVSIVAINTRVSDISDVEYSDSTYLNACFNDDKNGAYIIGLIVGGSLALLLFIKSLYMLLNWMKKNINEFKRLSIELPKGLETIDLITETAVEVDNIDRLDDLIRTDSSLNIMSHNIKIVDKPEDSVKNRHDSGISSAYNENIYIKHSLLGNGGLDRKISIDSGHGSSSSSSNMSSDSVVELDTTLQSSKYNNDLQRIRKMSSLSILDENSICNKDSSSGGDSTFLESNKKRNENNQKFKRLCIHSLLSKSEPTIFDSSFREDVSISKSLNNINLNSSITCDSKIGPIYKLDTKCFS